MKTMKLKFGIWAALGLALGSVQAQETPALSTPTVVPFNIPVSQLAAPATKAGTNYVAKGYCEDNIQYNVGWDKEEELSAAIYIPRSILGVYKDAQVAGVRIGLGADATGVSAFLIEGQDLTTMPTMSGSVSGTVSLGFSDILFVAPYQIADDLVVGYTAKGTNHIGMDGGSAYKNASYVRRNGEWGSIYTMANQNGWGCLSIQLLLTGDKMPKNEMAIGNILTKHAEQNKPFELKAVAHNMTITPVESYEVSIQLDNGYKTSQRISKHLEAGQTDTFSIAVAPVAKIGNSAVQVSITKVNDGDDEDMGNNTDVASINIVEEGCYFPRMVVVEEGTHINCGYCPRGIVVMESMRQRYPDTFIGIAVHTNSAGFDGGYDPMISETYADASQYFATQGLPNGVVNRKTNTRSGDPMYFERYYDLEAGQLAIAKVAFANVSEVMNGQINIETEVTFGKNYTNAPYRLAYALIEDGVTGSQQYNSFAGGNSGSMAGWEYKPVMVDMAFNDVARGIWDMHGLEGSLPASLTKKEVYKHTFSIPVPDAVQNNSNLTVVALLLDTSNGDEIMQAVKSGLGYNAAGIHPIAQQTEGWNIYADKNCIRILGATDATLSVYTLDGAQVQNENLTQGIYVVKATANGKSTTKKVIIR